MTISTSINIPEQAYAHVPSIQTTIMSCLRIIMVTLSISTTKSNSGIVRKRVKIVQQCQTPALVIWLPQFECDMSATAHMS